MDRNIKYVRDNRIANLLNDMVMQLLTAKPDEPLDALIGYLEGRPDAGDATAATAAKTPKPPAKAKPTENRPPRNGNGTDDSKPDELKNKPEAKPQEETEINDDSPLAKEEAPVQATEVPAIPTTADPNESSSRPISPRDISANRPKVVAKELDQILTEFIANEQEMRSALRGAFSSTMGTADMGALRTALATNNQLIGLAKDVSQTEHRVNLGLEYLKSTMSDSEFFLLNGFRLLHDINRNEREFKEDVFASIQAEVEAHRGDVHRDAREEQLLLRARDAHKEMIAALDQIESMQLRLSSKFNSNVVNNSLVKYAETVSHDISMAIGRVQLHVAAVEQRMPPKLISHDTARDREKLPIADQADFILGELAAMEHLTSRMLQDAIKGTDPSVEGGEALAALNSALANSKQMDAMVHEARANNTHAFTKVPGSYRETAQVLKATNLEAQNKVHLIKATFLSGMMKTAATVSHSTRETLKSENAKIGGQLDSSAEATLAKNTMAEIDRLCAEVERTQSQLLSHIQVHGQ